MISHDDYMKKLKPEQRAKVQEMARQLIDEEKSLREIRKARECSQTELAQKMGMNQGDLSKFERRTDMYLSTVRQYVEALGGTLELVANFPDTGAVKIAHVAGLNVDEEEEETAAT
jgi:transcriptional regulator with XRE-family HTH domain